MECAQNQSKRDSEKLLESDCIFQRRANVPKNVLEIKRDGGNERKKEDKGGRVGDSSNTFSKSLKEQSVVCDMGEVHKKIGILTDGV